MVSLVICFHPCFCCCTVALSDASLRQPHFQSRVAQQWRFFWKKGGGVGGLGGGAIFEVISCNVGIARTFKMLHRRIYSLIASCSWSASPTHCCILVKTSHNWQGNGCLHLLMFFLPRPLNSLFHQNQNMPPFLNRTDKQAFVYSHSAAGGAFIAFYSKCGKCIYTGMKLNSNMF